MLNSKKTFKNSHLKNIYLPILGFAAITLFASTTPKASNFADTKHSITSSYGKTIHQQWHTVQLEFEGPTVAEDAEDNPFLNYLLQVEFTNAGSKKIVRGFFAADGNAAETSSSSGNKWQVRFTPDKLGGKWSYTAHLYHKDSIGIYEDLAKAEELPISNSAGSFQVVKSDKKYPDFRGGRGGRIIASKGTFKFENTDQHWLKFGANSPENYWLLPILMVPTELRPPKMMVRQIPITKFTAISPFGRLETRGSHMEEWQGKRNYRSPELPCR